MENTKGIDLTEITEEEAIVYLDKITDNVHLDKGTASVALFSLKKLREAITELKQLRDSLDMNKNKKE